VTPSSYDGARSGGFAHSTAAYQRLAQEKSPYLLQHAHQSVDWYPWGKRSLRESAPREQPIFLSIDIRLATGATSWRNESFENEEVALIMNREFVNIKFDREERPDVDRVYMTLCKHHGSGGWPMSVWLTPNLQPFCRRNLFSAGRSIWSARFQKSARTDRGRLEGQDHEKIVDQRLEDHFRLCASRRLRNRLAAAAIRSKHFSEPG